MDPPEHGKTFDDALSHIGDWGPYQKRMLLFSFLACAGEGLQLITTIFTMGSRDFRCAVPGLANDTFSIQSEAHALLVNSTVPWDADKGGYSQCSRYKHVVNESTGEKTNWLPGATESCSRWVFSSDVFRSSIVSELELVCDRKVYVSHAHMMSMAGLMAGSIVSGALSDLFGRKKTFLVFYWVHMCLAFVSVLATTIPTFLAIRFLMAATGIAFYMSIYVLCAEIVLPPKRVLASMIASWGWVAGMIILLVMAYMFRYWKTLQLALSLLLVPGAFGFIWMIPESPRWLMNKGRYSEVQKIIVDIAKANKREIPEKLILRDMYRPTLGEKSEIAECRDQSTSGWRTLLSLAKSPVLAVRLAILSFSWAVNSMVYYGLTLNVGSIIQGDIYTNFLILALLEGLSYLMVLLLTRCLGRRVFYCLFVFIGGGACLATILPNVLSWDTVWPNVLLSNLGKFGISAAFGIIWLYTPELLPTPARQSGIGLCSFVGRLGAMVSPYIATLNDVLDGPVGESAPLLVFGAAAVAAGLLCLLLPETARRKLPETVEEAENIKRLTVTT
ncbi:hypothetical protein EGW08_017741 [Elysia chlorotica]|uniref:Major facilitator superfamily (MFS) profile domain-containing protein n=1 Tax=Elysia chlorotica TaxID=188477 RepID=A0A3S1B2H0_ELYCH|nr:hypothetical protein EGW08_017741 [Elysia chlorotica]